MRLRKQRKDPKRFALPGAGILAAVVLVAGAVLLLLLRRRGKEIKGAALDATESVRHKGRADADATLPRKVESELCRPDDAPKGDVVVHGRDGLIELRGQVERTEDVEALGAAAAKA